MPDPKKPDHPVDPQEDAPGKPGPSTATPPSGDPPPPPPPQNPGPLE